MKPQPTEIKLGYEVKDIVSGVSGTVMAITKWLTGCDTIVIEPKVGADGKKMDRISLDILSVEFVSTGVREKFYPDEFVTDAVLETQQPAGPNKPGGPKDPVHMQKSSVI